MCLSDLTLNPETAMNEFNVKGNRRGMVQYDTQAVVKKRKKLDVCQPLVEVIEVMSEGAPGAIDVLCRLFGQYKDMAVMDLLELDDMNIRGPQIWVGFKDHCDGDIEKFHQAIQDRDEKMVHTINSCGATWEFGPAVKRGASWEHA